MTHTFTINEQNRSLATCAGTCPITKKPWTLTVVRAEYEAWRAGALIQNAFPTLKAEEREMLQSGTSPEGWAILFPPTVDCPACKGTGAATNGLGLMYDSCAECGGEGTFTYPEAEAKIAATCTCGWTPEIALARAKAGLGHEATCPATSLWQALGVARGQLPAEVTS